MKYYSVPLKTANNGVMDYKTPDVDVAYIEHRHFDENAMTCKISVEDNVTVTGGTEIDAATWGTI